MAPDNDFRKELEELSPILSKIRRDGIYTAPPPGYFEELPSNILSRVKEAKVIEMKPLRRIWRTLAAAVATGAVLVTGWILIGDNSPAGHSNLSADATVQHQIQQVSDTEMAAYIDRNSVATGNDYLLTSGPITDDDVPLVLADVSDQELQQYVDQNLPTTKLN